MKRLTILFLFTLVTAQTGFKKSISIDCFNLPLGTLPLHLSFINDDSNMELNIPIYYQLFGKNSPITKYTGITKMFMTGINVRKFPNKSEYGKQFFLVLVAVYIISKTTLKKASLVISIKMINKLTKPQFLL